MSFFASIIPFEHSIGIAPLLYSGGGISIGSLRVGQIVEIPYGNKVENGIVAEIHTICPIDDMTEAYTRIKPMSRVITDTVLLAPYQIDMIRAIATRYMIPIHRVLAIFLTRPILSRLEKKNYEQLEQLEAVTKSQGHRQLHIVQDGIVTPVLVEAYTQSGPTIVILSDDYAMMPYREYNRDREDVLFVSSDMTDVRRAQAWIDIANGRFKIVYGTRRLLYYNLSRYTDVLYIEDALGPDYWSYPVRIRYSDIFRIFAIADPTWNITILTSVPTVATLTNFRHYPIKNISALCKRI